jgi:hypothetical protein
MTKVSVKVKWVKEKCDVDIQLNTPLEVFKTQIPLWFHYSVHCAYHSVADIHLFACEKGY